jgi:hypothetical protein
MQLKAAKPPVGVFGDALLPSELGSQNQVAAPKTL